MKSKSLYLLLVCTAMFVFSSCTKDTDVNMESFKIVKEVEKVTAGTTTATITGMYEFSGRIDGIKVRVGTSEQLFGSDVFVAEMSGKSYSLNITGMRSGTKYYYRYEVDYGAKEDYLTDISDFTTQSEKPTVKTLEVQAIDSTTYRIKCQVLSNGGLELSERGICWNTYGDPTLDDEVLQHSTADTGLYTIFMSQLEMGKRYYVRAYAKNASGIGFGNVLDFETEAPTGTSVEIELSCDPEDGGRVTGGGSYEIGTQCTATAEANAGYTFVNWTENGNQVSSEPTYTFPVTVSRSLVANFTTQAYVIYAEVEPVNSGTVTGAGGYNYGQECTLTATPNTGYDFQKWTKGGTMVSTNASFTFPVTETATYKAHFKIKSYTIGVSANPTNGGTVEGGGTYDHGQSCRVKATPAEGYSFTNWTDDGEVASEAADYTFTVTSNRTLVANFTELQANEYNISVSANPSEGGTVTGYGTYQQDDQCTVEATANESYTFINWTENGEVVSTNARYTFNVNSDRMLVANFTVPQAPEGAINGMFTIDGNGNKVYFSQGNLQFNPLNGTHLCADGTTKSGTWRFAAYQYDIIGNANSSIGEYYNGWIDLFGWGTSGYNDPSDPYNVNYYPWSTSWETVNEIYNYYGYGPSTNMPSPNLKDSSENYDWGVYNVIYGAGNQPNQWRTLTREEWVYVFKKRTTSSGIRYAKAQIIGLSGGESIIGMILLPDDWSTNYYTLSNTDQFQANFTSNIIEVNTWENSLEAHGAVFLPAAGYRSENSVSYVNHYGEYWSATYGDSSSAYYVHIGHSDFTPQSSNYERYHGFSVRLVHSVQ